MATTAQLQAWLTEAENAYHSLMMGGAVRVAVDQNGERVEFTAANAANLQKYIHWLKTQLGLSAAARPAGVFF